MSFAAAFAAAVGVPASVRVGVVTQDVPLRVNVQGTIYTNLGFIGALPSVGDTVALLGQSTSVTGSPSSWLVLGVVQSGE